MICGKTCAVALIFVLGQIIMTILSTTDAEVQNYRETMPEELRPIYDNIVSERIQIYYTGFLIGAVLALFIIIVNARVWKHRGLSSVPMVCLVVATAFITSILYYIVAPKSDYMANHLTEENDKVSWAAMSAKMRNYYFGSLLMGTVATGIFAYAFRGYCS